MFLNAPREKVATDEKILVFSQNRKFIYRGKEYERLGDFTTRILNFIPSAKKMTTTSPPDDDVLNSPGMRILACLCASSCCLLFVRAKAPV